MKYLSTLFRSFVEGNWRLIPFAWRIPAKSVDLEGQTDKLGASGENQLIAKPERATLQKFRYFAVLDFEATCQPGKKRLKPQEIIEFPVMLVDSTTSEVVDVFHEYVRPVVKPSLNRFCINLTGITQKVVSEARTIGPVYDSFLQFVEQHQLSPHNTAIVTCGDWDVKTMWPSQARLSGLKTHPLFNQFINIDKILSKYHMVSGPGMMNLLAACGLQHEGRHHSGIDDVRNIVRCLQFLLKKGTVLELTWTKEQQIPRRQRRQRR
ncbi:hypothetical protein BSKO_08635 [Bryopsis sp. KO-2023]|nr:hypothetical protein BSKO_08635 [Bryopsis sp. KO-2023]